jgi:hypothetical protein
MFRRGELPGVATPDVRRVPRPVDPGRRFEIFDLDPGGLVLVVLLADLG